MLVEALGEVRRGVEAHHIAYFADLIFSRREQLEAAIQADDADVVVRRLASDEFELLVEVRTAQVELTGKGVDREVLTCEVLKDVGIETVDELGRLLVVCLLLRGMTIVLKRVFGDELAYALLAVTYRAELGTELLDGKGLLDVGVGTDVETFDLRRHVGLGRKHDEGEVGISRVETYGTAELYAIHLGHHDIHNDCLIMIGTTINKHFNNLFTITSQFRIHTLSASISMITSAFN